MSHDFRSYDGQKDRCCKCERPKEPCVEDFTPWWADERRGGNHLLDTAMALRLSKIGEGGS